MDANARPDPDLAGAQAARERFEARRRLNAEAKTRAMTALAGGGSAPHAPSDEPAEIAAARRVAQAAGITLPQHLDASGPYRSLKSALEIAGVRLRRVLLPDGWWRADVGPLVGYLAGSGDAVALLPAVRSRWMRATYHLVNADGSSIAVDARVAATLAPFANSLHAPLPTPFSPGGVLRDAWRLRRREIVLGLLTGLASAVLGLVAPQAMKVLLEQAIPNGDRTMLLELGAAMAVAAVGAVCFDLAHAVSLLRTVATTGASIQTGLWDRMLRNEAGFFRRYSAGDLQNRSMAATRLRWLLNETVLANLFAAVVASVNVILMAVYSPTLAAFAVGVALVATVGSALASRTLSRLSRAVQDSDGQVAGVLVPLVNAATKLQLAGAESRAFAQWSQVYARKLDVTERARLHTDRTQLFRLVLAQLATAGVFALALGQGLGTETGITLGAFLAFNAAFGTFFAAATVIGDSTQLLLTSAAMWRRMTPIVEATPEASASKAHPGVLTGRVRLDHVSFRYTSHGRPTLDDVSLHAEPGECIAVVGPSGSGKSTIISMLLRFEVPNDGGVFYDDQDLNILDVLAVRRQLGVVTQENKILGGTFYDNIVSGTPATMNEVWEAARNAGLEDDIRDMPMGMHSSIAEAGVNLSGGQRQRLLIARALLRKPRIIILDEATSALDNKSQATVTDTFARLKMTRIVVAHRLSTIRQADRIYVIQAGRVVQEGTFDGLLAQPGLFQRLAERQMA